MDRGRVTFHWKKISENKRRTLPPKLRMEILKRDEYKCLICGSGDFLEIDHIKAIVFGGDNSKENLRVLCHECNMGKRFLEQEQIGKHEWKKKDSEMRRGKKLG
jgi:5-methylcytosine-specific restriction endonuclease McrA